MNLYSNTIETIMATYCGQHVCPVNNNNMLPVEVPWHKTYLSDCI